MLFPRLLLIFSILHSLVWCGSQFVFDTSKSRWDSCQVISGKEVLYFKEALDCYKSFPFNETIRKSTLDTLHKTLPFYAFVDISKKSPEPKIPSHADIYQKLDVIRDKHYDTELSFQKDLMDLFLGLNDGHTGYHSSCFTTFIFRQPFPIITVRYLDGQKFLVLEKVELPPKLEFEWTRRGFNISRYFGAEVLLINAIPPGKYLESYANRHIGASRDVNSRFNLALARVLQRNGKWGISNGNFASTTSVPEHSEVTYTFRLANGGDTETVTIPYLVSSPGSFKDKKDFYFQFCAPNSKKINKLSEKAKYLQIPQIPQVGLAEIDIPLPQTSSLVKDPLRNPLTKGKVIQTWMLDDDTGVMTITAFSAQTEAQFLKEASQGFRALRHKGAKKFLLDVSNNGGGVVCWGYYILDFLFPPSSNDPPHKFSTDMHESPLLLKLAKKDHRDEGFYNYKYWSTPKGGHFNSTKQFVSDHVYRRGGSKGHYTSQFQDRCGVSPLRSTEYLTGDELASLTPPWPASHIIVVTNSICYSTCSLLVNSLQEVYNVTTYAFGGIRGREATAASIQGGTVYNLDALEEDLMELGLSNHSKAPKNFITKASFTFTIREAYSVRHFHHPKKSGPRPLEFTWEPATYHVPYPGPVTFLSPFQQWRQISHDFSTKHL